MRRFLFIILILISGKTMTAQNFLPDTIYGDTVLSMEASPYFVGSRLIIDKNATLFIKKGVNLIIPAGMNIRNNGRLVVDGSEKNPVIFTTEDAGTKWGYINNYGNVIAEHFHVANARRFVYGYGDTIVLDYCSISNTAGGVGDDLIGVHNAGFVKVTNSTFEGDPAAGKSDALDLDGINNGYIAGNMIFNFSDDGIDIGTSSHGVIITNNDIYDCDMGISVGENSTVTVSRNLIRNCVGGIQSHFGSVITAFNNTLHGNIQGLRAYHNGSEETSGGTIIATNHIITNSNTVVAVKPNSNVELSFILSDSLLLPGEGNILAVPQYVDPQAGNFNLKRSSPAIDAGDPDLDGDGITYETDIDDQDPDGSRMDLGYKPFYSSSLFLVSITPSNLTLYPDDTGAYSDWFSIANFSDSTIRLKGFYLSDNPDNNLKYRITEEIIAGPGDTIVFRADDLPYNLPFHVPFKLSGGGEYLSISNQDGVLLDEKYFGWVPNDLVYKRDSKTENWIYSTWPENDTAKIYQGISGKPHLLGSAGEIQFPVLASLGQEDTLDHIYYSSDGSKALQGTSYASPVEIGFPLTLRYATERPGYYPSFTHASSFYEPGTYQLPVVSISGDEDAFYGDLGIYSHPWKEGPLWERPISFAYYGQEQSFSSISGIRIQGGNSVGMAKKSFRLYFRGGYGSSRLEATPFDDGPYSFKNLVLRSGYDDDITSYGGTLLRDPFSTEIWARMGELATQSDFVSLLLNNNYWGIYNIRESINENFIEDNLGYEDFDLVRFQKEGADLKYGTWDSWNELNTYFDTTNFTRPGVFDEVSTFMDMNSLLNLLSLVHCSQFRSWTWGAFVVKPEGGKWQWTIWDTDRSYNTLTWNGFTEYANTSAEKWPNFIPQALIKNEDFKHALINRNCDLLNSIFIPDDAISLYDSLVQILEPEMEAEYERWNPGRISNWEGYNESIRSFLRQRPGYLYNQMKGYFAIKDTVRIHVRIEGNGEVEMNSLSLKDSLWSGVYMQGIPISLKAKPGSGANFIEWRGISASHEIDIAPETYEEIVAVFDTGSAQVEEALVINEIMYHPRYSGSSEWIELYNPNSFSISLEGYKLSDAGVVNYFEIPPGSIIDPVDYLVLPGDFPAYVIEHGSENVLEGSFNDGLYGFNLSNGGESIFLYNASGDLEDKVSYADIYPWPVFADGTGPSLQLKSTELDNDEAQNWFSDPEILFTPGRENSDYTLDHESRKGQILTVFPNPFKNYILISGLKESQEIQVLEIFSLDGRKVYQSTDLDHSAQMELKIQPELVQPGIYLLRLIVNGDSGYQLYTRMILKE